MDGAPWFHLRQHGRSVNELATNRCRRRLRKYGNATTLPRQRFSRSSSPGLMPRAAYNHLSCFVQHLDGQPGSIYRVESGGFAHIHTLESLVPLAKATLPVLVIFHEHENHSPLYTSKRPGLRGSTLP